MKWLKNTLFLTERVTAVCGKQTEIGTVVFRTAIEAEILFAARVTQTRFLEAVIKPVHPCTFLPTCLQSKHATDVNHRRPWRF